MSDARSVGAPLTGGGMRRARESVIRAAFTVAAMISIAVLIGIFGVLFVQARDAFTGNEFNVVDRV